MSRMKRLEAEEFKKTLTSEELALVTEMHDNFEVLMNAISEHISKGGRTKFDVETYECGVRSDTEERANKLYDLCLLYTSPSPRD